MECKAEDPSGYLSGLQPLVFFLGNSDHLLREWNEFLIGRSVVEPPNKARAPTVIDQGADVGHAVVERETSEVGFGVRLSIG